MIVLPLKKNFTLLACLFFGFFCTNVNSQLKSEMVAFFDTAKNPVAVLIGVQSKDKKYIPFQFDTGSPVSFVLSKESLNNKVNKQLDLESISSVDPQILGDTGKRFRLTVHGQIKEYTETVAVISTKFPITADVVLGYTWLEAKKIQILFSSGQFIVDGEEPLLWRTPQNTVQIVQPANASKSRVRFELCTEVCRVAIFDTGFLIADVIEFLPLNVLRGEYSANELEKTFTWNEHMYCSKAEKKPIEYKFSEKIIKNLYHLKCAFEGDNEPLGLIFGIRSIIERKGSIYLNLQKRELSLDIPSQ